MKRIALVVLLAAFCLQLQAQFDAKSLDDILIENKKEIGNEGVAMIFKDGKVFYKKKIGEVFDEKTQVHLGNTSAWLTTILIMQFIDEGKLTLDTKVADYLPIFAKYSKKYITIRHCLAGMTGIQVKKEENTTKESRKSESLEKLTDEYVKREIRSNAGEDYFYTNVGLIFAARVVEVIAKKNFEQLIAQRVLKPMNMKNTNFYAEGGGCANPAEGAVSTATDFMNFFNMILNKGMFNGKKIISEESLNAMQTIQITNSMVKYIPKAAETYEQGLGIFIMEKDVDGKPTVIGNPNFYGLWATVDLCKKTGIVIFPAKELNDARKTFYTIIKDNVNEQLGEGCK